MPRLLRRAGLALLLLVLLLLSLVGLLTLVRDPAPARVYRYGAGVAALDVSTPAFARTAALLTGAGLAAGHRLEVLTNGEQTYPALWRDLRAARTSITAQLYYVTPGQALDSLSLVLRERASAGVVVHLLYDAIGADLPDSTRTALRAAGVRLAAFRPVRWYSLYKAHNRSHARVLVIDGVLGYTGGFGIDDRWLGNGRAPGQWRDTNVRFSGPGVAQLQAAFVSAWAEATGRLLVGPRYFPPPAALPAGSVVPDRLGPALAGILHSVPAPGTTAGQELFALSAAAARRTLYITSAYFVPGRDIVEMLSGAARRGVDVRLLLPGGRTDVPLTRWGARAHYETLLGSGVRIYEYQPAMIHAKTFVIDGVWSSIGSMNLDARSFVHNDEVTLVSWDREVGGALDSIFFADLRYARAITLGAFRDRPWRQRVAEAVARQLTKVL